MRITDIPPERAEKSAIRLERRQGRALIPAATQNWKQAPIRQTGYALWR
jgi:hypothetical protein